MTHPYLDNVNIQPSKIERFFEHEKSFKSKFIIEKQQNLLKKLHYENNILKNEASQLKSTNSRLVTKLRSRLVSKGSFLKCPVSTIERNETGNEGYWT